MRQRLSAGLASAGNRIGRSAGALLALLLFATNTAFAQAVSTPAPPPDTQMQKRMDDAAHMIADDPALKKVPEKNRAAMIEFVAGNMFFIIAHEMGHAHIGEMELPVLGREEDAADSFAVTTMLKMGTMMTDRILTESAMGWFWMAKRDANQMLLFYDEHGLDKQRAFQIVCIMVGSNPEKFKDLADESKLPKARQESCKGDYDNANWSWEQVLKPHLRKPGDPKTRIDVVYSPGVGRHKYYENTFKALHYLETVADFASETYVWPKPFTLEMRTCGKSDAKWSPSQRKVFVCYEMPVEFAELYRDFAPAVLAARTRTKGTQAAQARPTRGNRERAARGNTERGIRNSRERAVR